MKILYFWSLEFLTGSDQWYWGGDLPVKLQQRSCCCDLGSSKQVGAEKEEVFEKERQVFFTQKTIALLKVLLKWV